MNNLEDMQNSQQHITFYREVIFLGWGGNMLRKVESMMIILSSVSFSSFSTPYYGVITMILFCSVTYTCNKNFGNNCGSA